MTILHACNGLGLELVHCHFFHISLAKESFMAQLLIKGMGEKKNRLQGQMTKSMAV